MQRTTSVTGRRRYALILHGAGFAAPVHAMICRYFRGGTAPLPFGITSPLWPMDSVRLAIQGIQIYRFPLLAIAKDFPVGR